MGGERTTNWKPYLLNVLQEFVLPAASKEPYAVRLMPTSARADLLQEAKIWKSVLDSKNLGFSSKVFLKDFSWILLMGDLK